MNKMKIRSVLAAVLVFALSTLQLSSTMFSMNIKADEMTNEISSEDAGDEETGSSSEVTSEEETTPEETSPEETVSEDDKVITNDENGIPDANLYAVLLNSGDSNRDGKLTVGEAKKITSLSCELTKIGTFKNLAKYALNVQSLSDSTNMFTADAFCWNEEMSVLFCRGIFKAGECNIHKNCQQ